MSLSALLALLCLAQAPAGRGVQASADHLTITPSTHAWTFQGHATLKSRELVLRADEIAYDPLAERARADGEVVFSSGLFGGTALRLEVDLQDQTGTFQGATLYAKSQATPAEIAAARTPAQMHLVGKNDLTLRADELHRLSSETFDARGLYLTPCDCKAPDWYTEPPSWSIRARRAHIEEGRAVRLSWATLYVKDVPVLPVPLLLLPLSNRQTGFLLPHPFADSRNGFQLQEPFFWAMARSYDATFTPGYFFGAHPPGDTGMRGPKLGTEFRYVPSTDTHGRIYLGLVYDLKPSGDAPHRGVRGDLSVSHVQTLGKGWEDRVDLATISDQQYFRDVTADVVAAQASYLRSDARVDRRGDSTDLYLASSYYQSFALSPQLQGSSGLGPYLGGENADRFTFQRLPALGFSLLEGGLGPLRARVDVDGADYAPLSSAGAPQPSMCTSLDAQGVAHTDPGCAQTVGLLSARQPSQRLGVQSEVRLPLQLGRFAELDPYLLVRGDAWSVEPRAGSKVGSARALTLVGAVAQTELARTFGSSTRWRHVVTPRLELRAMPWSSGGLPLVDGEPLHPNDEFDAPVAEQTQSSLAANDPCGHAPAGPLAGSAVGEPPQMLQAVAAVRTRLQRKQGATTTEPAWAELGQGFDLGCREPADTYARAGYVQGPLSAAGEVRYSLVERRIAALTARAGWSSGGSSLSVGYTRLRTFLTDPMNAGILDLVGPPGPQGGTSLDPTVLAERLDLGGHWQASAALGLDVGMSFLPHARLLDAFSSTVPSEPTAPWRRLLQYSAGVSYGSPCNCWGLKSFVVIQPTPTNPFYMPVFFFLLDAHRLGGNLGG